MRGHYQAQLSDLLIKLGFDCSVDSSVSGVRSNIDRLEEGDIWLKYQPSMEEVVRARKKGAVAVLCFRKPKGCEGLSDLFELPNWQQSVEMILDDFYSAPAAQMQVIGVTGTNGKTSVAYLCAYALQLLNNKSGYIGTLGWGTVNKLVAQSLTTPDIAEFYEKISKFRDRDMQYLSFEASSHALSQGRVPSMLADVAVFTNLTHDHLDYHRDINHYLSEKMKLFEMISVNTAVINVDDPSGGYVSHHIQKPIWACSFEAVPRSYKKWSYGQVQYLGYSGMLIHIVTHQHKVAIRTSLLGLFNAYNLMLSHAALCAVGMPCIQAASALERISFVPGRLMPVHYQSLNAKVFIDFSHTPDALEQVLSTLKELAEGKIWVVFGCGGDRDKKKRPKMGAIAERYADSVVLTEDNSRSEATQDILNDILSGFKCPSLVMLNSCRYAAIEHVLLNAKANDTVLIAGMGDEKLYVPSLGKYISDIEVIESVIHGC